MPGSEAVERQDAAMQPVLLAWGIGLMLVLSFTPFLLVDAEGKADHILSMLLMWSMSAAFVRGFGFIPKNRVARYVLGTFAAVASALAAAAWRLMM
ncbi:MAG: cyd operon YbgE family protein [Neisseria sp.]|nr:cyd operon YbgE family protein [Neisseria sp.]